MTAKDIMETHMLVIPCETTVSFLFRSLVPNDFRIMHVMNVETGDPMAGCFVVGHVLPLPARISWVR